MRMTHQRRIEDLPLAELGIDIVVDCTGVFKTPAKVQPYYDAGVKKVVVSAPIKEEPVLNLVYAVHHDGYAPARHDLITSARCTTNSLAPPPHVTHQNTGKT